MYWYFFYVVQGQVFSGADQRVYLLGNPVRWFQFFSFNFISLLKIVLIGYYYVFFAVFGYFEHSQTFALIIWKILVVKGHISVKTFFCKDFNFVFCLHFNFVFCLHLDHLVGDLWFILHLRCYLHCAFHPREATIHRQLSVSRWAYIWLFIWTLNKMKAERLQYFLRSELKRSIPWLCEKSLTQ